MVAAITWRIPENGRDAIKNKTRKKWNRINIFSKTGDAGIKYEKVSPIGKKKASKEFWDSIIVNRVPSARKPVISIAKNIHRCTEKLFCCPFLSLKFLKRSITVLAKARAPIRSSSNDNP